MFTRPRSGRRHLAAVDERIRQLSKFRAMLANEVGKWDGVKEPTCGGLCQIIASADDEGTAPVRVELNMTGRDRKHEKSR